MIDEAQLGRVAFTRDNAQRACTNVGETVGGDCEVTINELLNSAGDKVGVLKSRLEVLAERSVG